MIFAKFARAQNNFGANKKAVWDSLFADRTPFLNDPDGAPEEMYGFKAWLGAGIKRARTKQQIGLAVAFGAFGLLLSLIAPMTAITELAVTQTLANSGHTPFGPVSALIMVIVAVLMNLPSFWLLSFAALLLDVEQTALARWFAPMDSLSYGGWRFRYWGLWVRKRGFVRTFCMRLAFAKYQKETGQPTNDKGTIRAIVNRFVNERTEEFSRLLTGNRFARPF